MISCVISHIASALDSHRWIRSFKNNGGACGKSTHRINDAWPSFASLHLSGIGRKVRLRRIAEQCQISDDMGTSLSSWSIMPGSSLGPIRKMDGYQRRYSSSSSCNTLKSESVFHGAGLCSLKGVKPSWLMPIRTSSRSNRRRVPSGNEATLVSGLGRFTLR